MKKTLKKIFTNTFLPCVKKTYSWVGIIGLSGCGGQRVNESSEQNVIGFSSDYMPPKANFDQPDNADPSFKILEAPLHEGYWITSLEMSDADKEISKLMVSYESEITFSFPTEAPPYIPVTITGWAPANDNIIYASRQIFNNLEEVLDIKIEETSNLDGFNNLAISQSIQAGSVGFSYFPNNYNQIGSDIFIDKNYANPQLFSNSLTNFDYEILVHEIGHSLGLKHPFEGDRNNQSTLNLHEDHTRYTAMSYNEDPVTFDGTFRVLDWMALTKLYGVNSEFRSGNDVYTFDDKTGIFIIDGNGEDTINNHSSVLNTFVDLRPGTHSYDGQKSSFITAEKQLTISHGSEIENVQTGSGDDTVIGNNLLNKIKTGDGDDIIFAGEGEDIIYPGAGRNTIDLSEDVSVRDLIVFEELDEKEYYDTVYGFSQGILGDALDISFLNLSSLTILPLVDVLNVPSGQIDSCLLRVFGEGVGDADSVIDAFRNSGTLENLSLSSGKKSVLITAKSQDTGELQNIFSIQKNSELVEVYQITQLVGNYLDIDNWSLENFII